MESYQRGGEMIYLVRSVNLKKKEKKYNFNVVKLL